MGSRRADAPQSALCLLGEVGALEQRHIAEDHGQQVVEVVRDSTGQYAEAVEALHLVHLVFELTALFLAPARLGHVASHRDEAQRAVSGAVAAARVLEPAPAAVRVAQAMHGLRRRLVAKRLDHSGARRREVVGMDQAHGNDPDQGARVDPEQLSKALVGERVTPVIVELGDQLGRLLGERPEPALALDHALLEPGVIAVAQLLAQHAVAHIARDQYRAMPSVRGNERSCRGLDPDVATVVSPHA